jgi:uncharacterized protein (DUF58 family)
VRAELERAIARYRLAPPSAPFAGPVGGKIGRAVGASLDFADFRDYVPGDDPRRVDWRAFARTDQLKIRLYREEVAPALDLCVDASASLAATPAKEVATRDLVHALLAWAGAAGARARLLALGGGMTEREADLRFEGTTTALDAPQVPLRPRGVRVVVSDFLTPDDPAPLLRKLAAGAAHVTAIQILDPWEADPTEDGALALLDVETGARRDVRLGPAAIKGYRTRLARLSSAVESATRAGGGRFATVVAAPPESMFGGPLLAAGVTEPR